MGGCNGKHFGRGWCQAHYHRWRKHGDPNAGKAPKGEPYRHLQESVVKFSGAECLIWPYARDRVGYAKVYNNGRTHNAHRIVCETVHGSPPTEKHQAAHTCGNGHGGCVNPNHLAWKTPVENSADKVSHGTQNRGERCNFSKISEETAREILRLKGTDTQLNIARRLGVSKGLVGDIQRGKAWVWLNATEKEEAA